MCYNTLLTGKPSSNKKQTKLPNFYFLFWTGVLPLASLRLMASPLQLMYSYMWQVIRQKKVKLYGKVEEFVTMVTQTVPELMSFKQTAQLILGLRARVRVLSCACIKQENAIHANGRYQNSWIYPHTAETNQWSSPARARAQCCAHFGWCQAPSNHTPLVAPYLHRTKPVMCPPQVF